MITLTYYGLHGVLKAQQGKGNDLASILLEASNLVSQSEGCYLYLISKNNNNYTNDEIWVTEIWRNKLDHDNSLQNPAVKTLISKAIPLLEGNPQKGQELDVLGGYGLDE